MDSHCTAQLTFVLGGLLGQYVTFERLTAFDGTARTDAEALFGAAFRLHFWHDTIYPFRDSSIFDDDRWQQYAALGCLLSLIGNSFHCCFRGKKNDPSRQNLRYRYSYRLPYRNTHRNKLPAMRKNMAYFFISSFSAPEP
jgi:hypothetical protein